MAERRTSLVILSYEEDRQQLIVRTIDSDWLASLVVDKLKMPIPLHEFGFTLDDEFAQLPGAAMPGLIALGQPALKQYLSVTSVPILRAGD